MTGPAPVAASRTLLRRLLRTASLAALVLLPVLAFAAFLTLRAPGWWRPGAREDAAATDRAAAFEQGLVAAFTQVRPESPEWAIRITAQDVNDWLATRLPAWLESRGESMPEAVQARFEPGRVMVGVRSGPFVPWWWVAPQAVDGALMAGRSGGGVGRLPLPLVAGPLEARWRESGLQRPIRLADGRQVRVLDVEVLADEIRLRLRTEPRPQPENRP